MPFSLRRDSDTRPSQKFSQIALCFLRSIWTATLRPFVSVTNWIPVMASFSCLHASKALYRRLPVRSSELSDLDPKVWVFYLDLELKAGARTKAEDLKIRTGTKNPFQVNIDTCSSICTWVLTLSSTRRAGM